MNDWVNFWRKALKDINYFSGREFCGSIVGPSRKEKSVRALFPAVEASESISKRHQDVRERGGETEAGPARSVWSTGPHGSACTRAQVPGEMQTDTGGMLPQAQDGWQKMSVDVNHHNTRPNGTSVWKKKDLNQVFWEERKRSDDAS